jgi:hypothetical protein
MCSRIRFVNNDRRRWGFFKSSVSHIALNILKYVMICFSHLLAIWMMLVFVSTGIVYHVAYLRVPGIVSWSSKFLLDYFQVFCSLICNGKSLLVELSLCSTHPGCGLA